MSEIKKYIGVTIGPIFDTINLSSSPAALWAGSYMFSFIARKICEEITENGVPETDIVVPFYKKDAPILMKNDGIGLFHDRVIFKADSFDINDFGKIKNKVIRKVSETFLIEENYLENYLLISAAEFFAEKPIFESGRMLDCLELAKTFVKKDDGLNPIVFSNSKVKSLGIVKGFGDGWQLYNEDKNIKSLPDIALDGRDGKMKKHHYYAVLRSDGDNISKIIKTLDKPETVREFSETCLNYCSDAATLVRNYGGVTIYSGGDDLLAVLPVENKYGVIVVDIAQTLTGLFKTKFEKYNKDTSLSVGIFMCYENYPLYEALESSASMLFDVAKVKKNCIAVRLQKHSGQSAGLLIENDASDRFIKFETDTVKIQDPDVLLSAMHKISLFDWAFKAAGKDSTAIFNLFRNTFDADSHKDNGFVKGKLDVFYDDLCNKGGILALDDTAKTAVKDGEIMTPEEKKLREAGVIDDPVTAIGHALRILKFFVEKGDGKE